MIELKHLRTLVILEKEQSLSSAAKSLHLTQSALSHQIKELEERLALPIFVRKSKPLQFTLAGEELLALAHRVLPQVDTSLRKLNRLAQGDLGRLHIAIECHSCFKWLIPTIHQFRRTFSGIELDFSSHFQFAPLPALLRGDLDLVVTADPVPLKGIHFEPLFDYESLIVLSPEHSLTSRAFALPEQLVEETLITYPVDRNRLDIFTHFFDPAVLEPKAIRTSELTLMIIQWVMSGLGYSCLPNWALSEYAEPGFVSTLKMGPKGVFSRLYMAYRIDEYQSIYIAFIEMAKLISTSKLQGVTLITNE